MNDIELNDIELNEWLHKSIMKQCVHDIQQFPNGLGGSFECTKCRKGLNEMWHKQEPIPCPNYCNDLNAVAKVEKELLDKFGLDLVIEVETKFVTIEHLFFSSARLRAEVCKKTWEQLDKS